jgi:voltage-gated potassium channel
VDGVLLITLRRLRAPLIVIGVIFALSTLALTLAPGVDEQGHPWRMTLFQAFYFVTYTATTIGFGEIPHAFTDLQRAVVTLIIYLSVIGWAYLLAVMLGLVQDKGFQAAVVNARFRRSVARLSDPFYLVCGLGDTGMAVVRTLDELGYRFTAIDKDERKIQELEIDPASTDAPAMVADARSPETLSTAGLLKPECAGVLALSNDDETNLAVAIAARILRPGLAVIGRADSPATAASMTSLGAVRAINPFREFGERLEQAMRSPDVHRLIAWLTSAPGSYLFPSSPTRIPSAPGHWIVCGYGRFGREITPVLQRCGFRATVIEPAGLRIDGLHVVKGSGADIAALREAGGEKASGVIAGTDDDTANLAIAISARRINPDVFVILRQNQRTSRMLFAKFGANMTMVPSEIIANQCIAALRTPLLTAFLDIVRRKDDLWAYSLSERLRALVGGETPRVWSVIVEREAAPGLVDVMDSLARPVVIDDLSRRLGARDARLAAMAVMIVRGEKIIELPDGGFEVAAGDQLLFVGARAAEIEQRRMLDSSAVVADALGGRLETDGWMKRTIGRVFPPRS